MSLKKKVAVRLKCTASPCRVEQALNRLLTNAESCSADLQIGCSGDVHIPALRGILNESASSPSVDLEVHATAELGFGVTRFARTRNKELIGTTEVLP
jgi:hypothetical protein